MELILKHGIVLTMDDACPVLHDAFVGIDAGKIVYVGTQEPRIRARREIDMRGKLLMPGLINAHTHVPMTLLRGYADDYALQTWLFDHVFPIEAKLDARCIKVGALLGMMEQIRCGITSISDMYFRLPAIAEVAAQAGIKANLSNGATYFGAPEQYCFETDGVTAEMNEMLERWHGYDGGRIRLDAAVHAEYTSFDGVWRATADFARRHDLNVQVHLSETRREHEECVAKYGKTPARLFEEAGLFDARTTAAHCVYVSDEDMELMARHGVTAAHNPVSNLKLGSGVARVPELLARGVNVALGTDGVCSNNSHDMFEEIKLAAILQKGVRGDPTLLPAWQALTLATKAGAFAQRREDECGMVRVGMDADLILISLDTPSLLPVHHVASHACYAASGRDVCLTMVRGEILYENGEYKTIDFEQIKHELETYAMPRLFGTSAPGSQQIHHP